MTEYLFLAAAAFFAGMLNTVAGGGTFLTCPAHVHTGEPPFAANATSAVVPSVSAKRSPHWKILRRGPRRMAAGGRHDDSQPGGRLCLRDVERLLLLAGIHMSGINKMKSGSLLIRH
ncbi:hypothetical protein [Nitratireductor mangrovi]|uniref:hypothetical protein n=1 Tax=Nitratireductor mangrovi TaxID=2599600 RepID=UPI001FEF51B5|nr:hypothetical protein [Nitratireductor mangrovi]